MSLLSIDQLVKHIVQDPAQRQQLEEATSFTSLQYVTEKIGQEKGFSFTSAEIEQWFKQGSEAVQVRRTASQLSAAELETIASGFNLRFPPTTEAGGCGERTPDSAC